LTSLTVDLVDRRLVGVVGQFRLHQIDLLAHIVERPVDIEAGLELHQNVAAALVGGRADFLDALDRAHLRFHGAHQQAL
jgi:hypothetical protein